MSESHARMLLRPAAAAATLLLAACGGDPPARHQPVEAPFTVSAGPADAPPGLAPVARPDRGRRSPVRAGGDSTGDAGAKARASRPDAEPRALTARIVEATALRARPRGEVLARLGRRTEFGSPRVLAVTGKREGWLRVLAPELPNGRHGWIPAHRAAIGTTEWSVRVDRSARRLVLRRGGRRVAAMRVAVGRSESPTPLGTFAVTDKLEPSDPASPYGCCIVALTGHQTRLAEGWPGGDRLAIHATPARHTIGRAASLGCLRAHDGDVRRLMRTVPLGTPVRIVA